MKRCLKNIIGRWSGNDYQLPTTDLPLFGQCWSTSNTCSFLDGNSQCSRYIASFINVRMMMTIWQLPMNSWTSGCGISMWFITSSGNSGKRSISWNYEKLTDTARVTPMPVLSRLAILSQFMMTSPENSGDCPGRGPDNQTRWSEQGSGSSSVNKHVKAW